MRALLILLAIVSAFALVAFGIVKVCRKNFRVRVAGEVTQLLASEADSVGWDRVRARWSELPEPVKRYMRYAITPGTPAMRTVHTTHGGTFRPWPGSQWMPTEGEEWFTVGRPGFVWHASVRIAPGVWFGVRDRLLEGKGEVLASIEWVAPVVDSKGTGLSQGSLMRWLAETTWFPYALLGDDVKWLPLDDHSAVAMLTDGDQSVRLTFAIDDEGKITSVSAERWYEPDNGMHTWRAYLRDYQLMAGCRVPTDTEVTWVLDDGEYSYARFKLTAMEPNPDPAASVAHLRR